MKPSPHLLAFILTGALAVTAARATIVTDYEDADGKTAFDNKITLNLIRASQPTLASMEVSHGSWNASTFPTAGLNDGSAAANANLTYYATKNPTHGSGSDNWLPVTITFTLAGSDTGYDITEIQSIAGWSDSYIGDQKFQLLFSINGGEFVDYGTYTNTSTLNGGNYATFTSLTDDSGVIASGVTAIQFIFLDPGTSQAGDGGTVIHELQAFGTPTAVPEPQALGLLGMSLTMLTVFRSRRRH